MVKSICLINFIFAFLYPFPSNAFLGLGIGKSSLMWMNSKIDEISSNGKLPKLGFIGLGIMGDGMARCLMKGGHSLRVWNRSPEKLTKILDDFPDKIIVVDNPASVIASSDITFVMLSTPDVCHQIYNGNNGVLAGITSGKYIVDCATLQPNDMKQISLNVVEKGGIFLEAPVSGSKVPAETGKLVFMAAGDKSLFERSQPYFQLMGKSNYYLGEQVGTATKLKLIVNSMMANMLATLAEGLSLADATEIDPKILLQVVADGAISNPMFAMKGPTMIAGTYAPNFPLKYALKDLDFARLLAQELNIESKLSDAASILYTRALQNGLGDEDFAAVRESTKDDKISK